MSESSIEHAREARARKAELLRDLSTGRITLEEALTANPRALRTTPLYAVLGAAHKMGPVGVQQTCEESKVFPTTLMGVLTRGEIKRIIEALPKRVRP